MDKPEVVMSGQTSETTWENLEREPILFGVILGSGIVLDALKSPYMGEINTF